MNLQLVDGGFYVDGHGNIVGPWDKRTGRAHARGRLTAIDGSLGSNVSGTYAYGGDGRWESEFIGGRQEKNNLVRRYVATLRVDAKYKRRDGVIGASSKSGNVGWMRGPNDEYEYPIYGHPAGYLLGEAPGASPERGLTHEILDDGTKVPLPETWEEHDAYVADMPAARRAIEMVAADVPGRYRLRTRHTGVEWPCDLYADADGVLEVPDGHDVMARVLKYGTEVRIGSLMIELTEAMEADAKLAPPTDLDLAAQAADDARTTTAHANLADRRASSRVTARDMACGFFPKHWG